MPLYEYWDVSDPALASCQGDFWQGESFTPRTAHTITSVKLKLYRLGAPGTLTASIRATDVGGHPTGGDLCSGTTSGDSLPAAYAGEWREITLGAGAPLSDGVKYAIVLRALAGDQNNYVRWRYGPSASYPRGFHEFSSDGGVTWESDLTRVLMFEEWGSP